MKYRLLPLYVLLSAVLWAAAGFFGDAVRAEEVGIPLPEVSETIRYYDVSSLTAVGLRNQMRRRGPRGYWAYAQWWVSWTAECQITLTQTIDMPRHTRPDSLPADLRVSWDRMITALLAHERVHTGHGASAAAEIAAAQCEGAYEIIDRWAAEDQAFDRRTDHGRLEGVVLP
jgi:predicted secreted Zn-dependent protease